MEEFSSAELRGARAALATRQRTRQKLGMHEATQQGSLLQLNTSLHSGTSKDPRDQSAQNTKDQHAIAETEGHDILIMGIQHQEPLYRMVDNVASGRF